jgi:hypothetical protein
MRLGLGFVFRLELLKRPITVGLVSMTALPEAICGLHLPFKTTKRYITVCLVSLIEFPEARTVLDFPSRTTEKVGLVSLTVFPDD